MFVRVVAGYPPPDFAMGMFTAFQKSMSFATFSTDTVPVAAKARRDRRGLVRGRGPRRTAVRCARALSLEEAVLAHQKMAAGEVFGRIVLTP